jgi:hypothetical protein
MSLMGPRALAFEPSATQHAAFDWGDGPLMVLAGAGIEETTVVVEQVRHVPDTDRWLGSKIILVLTHDVRARSSSRPVRGEHMLVYRRVLAGEDDLVPASTSLPAR